MPTYGEDSSGTMPDNGTPKPAKLPVRQLAILAVARFAEPLALLSVFPYLPEMIASFGVEKNQVAKWAGYTGAVFSVSQAITAVGWGRASDIFGRKPVILVGLISTMICFILWGLSTNLAMAITVRAIMGGGNGNVGILRTMIAELCPERELQPRAFSLMPLVWSIGSVFGPAFGGFFAQPARQYPSLFGDSAFFNRYPFALPNLVAAVVFFFSATTGFLFLKETLETKRHARDCGLVLGEKLTRPFHRADRLRKSRPSFCDDEAQAPLLAAGNVRNYMSTSRPTKLKKAAAVKPPSMSEVFTRQTTINVIAYTFLALHSVAFDQVLPVFLNYPPMEPDHPDVRLPLRFSGGFGMSSDEIGTIFMLYGLVSAVIQFGLFPWLCTRFGVLPCFRVSAAVFPLVYLVTPFLALITGERARYLALLALMSVKGAVVIIGFPCTTILLTNGASSLRILGTLNGFATTFSALGRAAGPAATGATFTWGVERGYVVAPWFLLAAVAAVGAVPSWYMVDGEGMQRVEEDEETEEEEDTETEVVSEVEGRRDETAVSGVRPSL